MKTIVAMTVFCLSACAGAQTIPISSLPTVASLNGAEATAIQGGNCTSPLYGNTCQATVNQVLAYIEGQPLTLSGLTTGTQVSCLGLTSGDVVVADTGACGSGGAGLTSVGLSTTASWLTIGSSPLTANGTLTITPTAGLAANEFLATPNGSSGPVGLRHLVNADLPTSGVTAGSYSAATITVNAQGVVTSAANNSLGTFAAANYASPPPIGGTTPAAGYFTTLSVSSSLTLSGVVGGTQVSCLGITSANVVVTSSGACASQNSITPGTTTVSGATAPCVIMNSTGTTMACPALGGGLVYSSSNNTIGETAPVRTVTASTSIGAADMGGQINSNVTGGGTLTIPAISSSPAILEAGMTVSVVNYSTSTLAVSSTPTVNAGGGCVVGTGIPPSDSWQITSNGTTLDCFQTESTSSAAVGEIASAFQTTSTLAGTQYIPFKSFAPSPEGQTVAASVVPRAGTVEDLYVHMDAAQGTGDSVAITLVDNNTAEAVTCTVAAGTSSCTDTTHTFTFAAGDLLEWETVQTGTGTASTISLGFLIY